MLRMPSQEECKFAPPQMRRLERFATSQCVDMHCHCLPGMDDGPKTPDQARALCQALVSDGITTVIATPHQMGLYEGCNSAGLIRRACAKLNLQLEADGITLRVVPGADVRVDDQLVKLLDSDHILTLADGKRFLLLELPHEALIDLTLLISELSAHKITTIVSHPERHSGICRCPEVLIPWMEQGALLQVTAGSLVGGFGPTAEKMAWDLIAANLVSLVATDAHDAVTRPPMMSKAIDAVVKRVGHAVARRLFIENPQAVLAGHALYTSQHTSQQTNSPNPMRLGGR